MIKNNPTNVSSAFEILIEEIEAEIDFMNKAGAKAFETRDYERVKEALERAGGVTAFRDKLAAMRQEWEKMTEEEKEDEETIAQRRNLGRLSRGVRTPEESYYKPILEVLNKMGGSGQVSEVLKGIEQAMKKILKKVDYEPLVSEPEMPRWRNAAQWARNTMVKDGRMKADSPRGIWEISEQGRKTVNI